MGFETMISLLGVGLMLTGAYFLAGCINQKHLNAVARREAQSKQVPQRTQAVRRAPEQETVAKILGSSNPAVLKEDFTPEQWETLEQLKASYRVEASLEIYAPGVIERRGER